MQMTAKLKEESAILMQKATIYVLVWVELVTISKNRQVKRINLQWKKKALTLSLPVTGA